jgi:hypothetical protein
LKQRSGTVFRVRRLISVVNQMATSPGEREETIAVAAGLKEQSESAQCRMLDALVAMMIDLALQPRLGVFGHLGGWQSCVQVRRVGGAA